MQNFLNKRNNQMNRAIKKASAIVGSQEKLAKLTGLSQAIISQYERGFRKVSAKNALKIEKAVKKQVMRHEMCPDVFKGYVLLEPKEQ